MIVQPFILRLGPIEISGFGLLMLLGFVAGAWVIRRELLRRGLPGDYATEIFLASALGGILGAKLWYAALVGDPSALLARSGMVWYGGLLGGFLAVIFNGWRRGVPIRFTLEIVGPALALAYALGRVGCFLVGDDYGVPTDVPWGVKFPRGLPPSTAAHLRDLFGVEPPPGTSPTELLAVHPTQLYEAAAMLGVFWILQRARSLDHGADWLFGLYLALAAAERFLVEVLRAKDDRFFGPLTLAQVASVAVAIVGGALMLRWRRPKPETVAAGEEVLREGTSVEPRADDRSP